MENIKIASAQFEHRTGDKEYNLGIIEKLSAAAAPNHSAIDQMQTVAESDSCPRQLAPEVAMR